MKLYIPAHSRLPENWKRTGERVTPTRTIREGAESSIEVIKGNPSYHKEKAMAVRANVNGMPVMIVGGGQDFTEDMKDTIREIAEDAEKFANEYMARAKERAEAKRKEMQEHLNAKIEYMKRNPRTAPDPAHTKKASNNIF